MKCENIIERYHKNLKISNEFAESELRKNIINYTKDKVITLLVLSGKKHCDAGHLVNQYKRIFN